MFTVEITISELHICVYWNDVVARDFRTCPRLATEYRLKYYFIGKIEVRGKVRLRISGGERKKKITRRSWHVDIYFKVSIRYTYMNYISPMYTLLFMRFYFKYLHGHQYTFSISHIFFCNFNTISDTFLKMIQLCKLIFNWFFITSINLKPLEIIYLQDKNKNSNWIGYWRQFENKYKINFPCLFIKWFIIFF